MNPFLAFVTAHWFAVLLLVVALVPGAFALRSRLRGALSLGWLLTAAGLVLAGVGGLALEPAWGFWVAVGAAAAFFVMVLVLTLTSSWVRPLAYAVGAVLMLGLGGLVATAAGEGLVEAGKVLASLEPSQPWWLLLLLLVPLVFWFSYRSLAGLGPVRRWVALGLRCLLLTLLALALAELRIKHQNENVTVLFLVDRSLSVPEETDVSPTDKNKTIDRRWERVKKFVNESVEKRPSGHERDKAGLIAFGRRPRLELPPSDAPRFKFQEVASTLDGNYTDIAAAIKLALASFPEGSGKRIVLLSDGNENLGNAEEQARIAKQNGVQIDVVPLGAGQRNENEVLVERVEAPPIAEQGARLPIRVLLRNHNPNPVIGELVVKQVVQRPVQNEGREEIVPVEQLVEPPRKVKLAPGLTSFSFKQPLSARDESYTYRAEFVPEGVLVDAEKGELRPLTGDRVQNNKATTHVVARGRRRVLLVEAKPGQHAYLEREMAARKIDIRSARVDALPTDKDKLTVLLSNFDCLILADVPAETLNEEQQEAIRSNTHEQGCGLIMVGGPDSFGAGGWQNTAVEKALPVESEIKALKVQGKGGLVLIMHASEMADGNFWQKKIAKLAVEKLSSIDEFGLLHYDWGAMKWHIPLQEIGDKRDWLNRQIDKLVPGDMPDFDPGLKMAHADLSDPKRNIATKHVIIISDGDPGQTDANILGLMRRDKVTVSTVGVATHGAPQDQQMARIANATGGRYHKVTNPNLLPAVYIKETRLVSQSFIYEKQFRPRAVSLPGGPTENLGAVPSLYGFVRTTPRQSPLVGIPIESPELNGQTFPVLAYWQYGLGKSVAFTSDARSQPGKRFWDRDWADSDMYVKFWEQVITWSLRPTESKNMVMTTEMRDGKMKFIIDARDDDGKALTDLTLRGKVTTPSGKAEAQNQVDLDFKQTNAGLYEAELKGEEAGSYFINVQAWGVARDKDGKPVLGKDGKPVEEATDSVRSGVTVPYSPEYSDLETNTTLLEKLRALTDGQSYADDGPALAEAATSGEVFRKAPAFSKNLQPVWQWLLFLTATLLLFDVATRRIALEFGAVGAWVVAHWDRLRGRNAAADRVPEYIDRLKVRKAQVGEALGQAVKAARRFEGDETTVDAPPPGADEAKPRPEAAPRPAPRPRQTADAGQEGGDYLSRLKKAKKRAMEDRGKEKDEE